MVCSRAQSWEECPEQLMPGPRSLANRRPLGAKSLLRQVKPGDFINGIPLVSSPRWLNMRATW